MRFDDGCVIRKLGETGRVWRESEGSQEKGLLRWRGSALSGADFTFL